MQSQFVSGSTLTSPLHRKVHADNKVFNLNLASSPSHELQT